MAKQGEVQEVKTREEEDPLARKGSMQHAATLHSCYESSEMEELDEYRKRKAIEVKKDRLARIACENDLRATLEREDVDEITEKLTPQALVGCNTNALRMAMEVSFQLRHLADKKGPGEDEYTKMANSVDEFTNCLLEPLKFDTENRDAFGDSLDDIIDDGIEKEQKTLFAHPVMYNLMQRKWWGIFGEMSRCSWLKLSYWAWLVLNVWCLFDIFLFPVLFAVFYIKHHMNLNKGLHGKDLFESYHEYFTTPYFVFIRDTLSYLALLGLHFALCLEKSSIEFSGLEWAIFVFFLGRILMECRQFLSLKLQPSKADGVFLQRFRKYLSDRWNILDLMTLLIYIVTFFLRVVTWAESESVTDNRALITSGYLYGLNTMFLTLRAFGQGMETVKSVGVIQIALFHIIGNVATIFLQFIATILAFSIAITKVYMAERSFVSDNTIREPACKSSDGLACWWTTVKLLTWSLLGIVELDPFDSVDIASVTLIHFLFGAFLIMGVILLVNMMIALLSNTYQRVEDNALKEWSFKKAITIQTYSSYHPIPVPLNLISHVVLCIPCLRQICERKCTGIPRTNKTGNTSLDEVVKNLQRMYIETYGYSFPLTDERKIDHILKETERNRQMANHITYRTFTSRGVEEDMYPTGPKAWQSKGIRVHGCLLTYEGSQPCLQYKDKPVKYHGARYLSPFSPDTPHFEVLIQETGKRRLLSVGVVGKDYGNIFPPGWFKGTVGYHVDDGKIFDADKNVEGVEYGGEAIAHRGCLIGCTVRFELAKGGKVPVVFTLNGKHITSDEKWIEYTPNKKSLYPYICMGNTGITVLAKMCQRRKADEGLKPLKTNADGRTHENGRIHEDERTHEDGRIQKDDGQLFAEQFDTELALEEMDEDFKSSFREIDRYIKIAEEEMVTGQENFKRLADDILYDLKRFETEIKDDIAKKKGYSRNNGLDVVDSSPLQFYDPTVADQDQAISLERLCEKNTETNVGLRSKFRAVIMALNQFKVHTTINAQRQTELMEKVKARFHVHEKFIRTSLPITKDAVLVSTEGVLT